MDCSMPGFPVHHQLLELAQTCVRRFIDAIQPSRPLSSHSSLAFNLSQHQGFIQWVSSSRQVAKVSIQSGESLNRREWGPLRKKALHLWNAFRFIPQHQNFPAPQPYESIFAISLSASLCLFASIFLSLSLCPCFSVTQSVSFCLSLRVCVCLHILLLVSLEELSPTTRRLIWLYLSVQSLSCVQLFVTLWTIAHKVPLSMEFSKQEYWGGLPFPSLGDLLNPGMEPRCPELQADGLPSEL